MTDRLDKAGGRDILARGCLLAEQRLQYLTELFETGRWRRFHSEPAFLDNIREAKTSVEIWRGLMQREVSRDNSVVEISWLARSPSTAPLRERALAEPQRPSGLPEFKSTPPHSEVSVARQPHHVVSDQPFSIPPSKAPALQPAAKPDIKQDLQPDAQTDLPPVRQQDMKKLDVKKPDHSKPEPSPAQAPNLRLVQAEPPSLDISVMRDRYPLLRNVQL